MRIKQTTLCLSTTSSIVMVSVSLCGFIFGRTFQVASNVRDEEEYIGIELQ